MEILGELGVAASQTHRDEPDAVSASLPSFRTTGVRLPPRLTQTVKTLFAVRSKELDRQGNVIAYSEPVGEAEAGHAGEQTAKE